MMPTKERLMYDTLVVSLREYRRAGGNLETQREILENLEYLYPKLSFQEQAEVNNEGWKGWPDQYDAKMETSLVETDPEDPACQECSCRKCE